MSDRRTSTSPAFAGLALAGIGLLTLAPACQAPADSDGEAEPRTYFDRPHQIPPGLPYEAQEMTPEPQEVEKPEDCPRGRGIDAEGRCVILPKREFDHGGMVQIPAGQFIRGGVPPRLDAEKARERPHVQWPGQPLFAGELGNFWMDGIEVTRAAYADCVALGECTPARCLDGSDGRPTTQQLADQDLEAFPQTCVTHEQAAKYCEWRDARLPTEAEWEYAARGPKGWIFPWGPEFRDEVGLALGPVAFDPLDVSYFGLRGFGGNAIEWTADPFGPDDNLMNYLAGEFRSEDGPMAKAWAAWQASLCAEPGCELGQRYAIKGGRVGARAGAWQFAEGVALAAELPGHSFEGDDALAQHPRLGFRCADDLDEGEPELTVPERAGPVAMVRQQGGYEVFMAVAEAVNREEAERFCQLLRSPGDSREPDAKPGWRLPTTEEIEATLLWFRGPGPYWTRDGAARQTFVDTETADWESMEVDDQSALVARCIRTIG